jgi:metal-sulfur cluster biosynthetic enzyme
VVATVTRPSIKDIWRWLAEVPDPEIPVVSVTDLGIVRDLAWDGDTLVVTVTPTYSGCPATTVINLDIERALNEKGIERSAPRVARSSRPMVSRRRSTAPPPMAGCSSGSSAFPATRI